MKVKALMNYKDTELNRMINKDEVIDVSEERVKQLLKGNITTNNKAVVEVLETADKDITKLETPKDKPKRKKANK